MGMLDKFAPNLRGIGTKVLFGTDFEIDAEGGTFQIEDANGNLVPVQVADGGGLSDVATVKQLREDGGFTVAGQIDGSAPPDASANDGAVFIVTTAGGSFSLRELYVARGGNWVALTLDDGQPVTVADDLTGGTIAFPGGRLYVYDAETDTWVDNGKTTSLSGVILASQTSVAYTDMSPASVHTATSGSLLEVRIRVLTPIDDGGSSLTSLTDGSGTDVVDPSTLGNIDLTQTGETVLPVSHDANTDIELAHSFPSPTQGQLEILIKYRSA